MANTDEILETDVMTGFDDYGKDSGDEIELLDDIPEETNEVEPVEEDEYSPERDAKNNLKKFLDAQLKNYNELTRSKIDVYYRGSSYQVIVMGKSKLYSNRYVFKIQDGSLKVFNIDEIEL